MQVEHSPGDCPRLGHSWLISYFSFTPQRDDGSNNAHGKGRDHCRASVLVRVRSAVYPIATGPAADRAGYVRRLHGHARKTADREMAPYGIRAANSSAGAITRARADSSPAVQMVPSIFICASLSRSRLRKESRQ